MENFNLLCPSCDAGFSVGGDLMGRARLYCPACGSWRVPGLYTKLVELLPKAKERLAEIRERVPVAEDIKAVSTLDDVVEKSEKVSRKRRGKEDAK